MEVPLKEQSGGQPGFPSQFPLRGSLLTTIATGVRALRRYSFRADEPGNLRLAVGELDP